MFVSCHMPKKVRVGRSAFFFFFKFFFLCQKGFCEQNRRKIWLAKKNVKNCKKRCFSGDFQKKKRFARVVTISRDGRVTGNKHIFCIDYRHHNYNQCIYSSPFETRSHFTFKNKLSCFDTCLFSKQTCIKTGQNLFLNVKRDRVSNGLLYTYYNYGVCNQSYIFYNQKI